MQPWSGVRWKQERSGCWDGHPSCRTKGPEHFHLCLWETRIVSAFLGRSCTWLEQLFCVVHLYACGEKTCKWSFINMEYKIWCYLIQRNLVLSTPPFLFQQECLFWSFHSCKFLMVRLKEKRKPLSQMGPGIHSTLPVHAKSSRSP